MDQAHVTHSIPAAAKRREASPETRAPHRRRGRRTAFALAALSLSMSGLLAACTGGESPAAPNQRDGGAAGGPVQLSVFSPQDANTDLKTNTYSKLLEQKLNIQFNWQVVPYDAAKEKRQIALSSGDYPDVFLMIPWVDQFSQTDMLRYGKQGVLLPLNDLIDKYAPNVKKMMQDKPYFKSSITAPDGNIYGLTQVVECYHCSYPSKLWLNTKWLKQLGLEMPKTTDDFRKVLQAFKTKDPNGNGKADEIPLSGANNASGGRHVLPFLMNAFIYDDDTTYFIMKDGKVDMAANKPEWKQGLAYARSLVKDGLIDTGAFTQNSDAYKQLGDKADAQLLGAGAAMHPGIFVTTGTERDKDYNPLPPLTGPGGAHNTLWRYGDVAGATFAITNKASEDKQIAAMKLIDYLFSEEGTTLGYFGEKGVSWKDAGPDDEGLGVKGKITPIAQAPNSPPLNNKWGALAQYYNTAEYRATWTAAKDIYTAEGYERRLFEATKLYEGNQPKEVYPYWSVWVDTAVADEAAMLRQNITDYIEQNMLQFVTGTKDLDKDWDAYVSGFNNLNLPRYLQIYQEAYDKSMK